jgi:cell division topological specificity factor
MAIKTFFRSLFSKQDSSAATATHRMKLMLTHDRQQVNPGVMEQMKAEILEVISKYFDIDPQEAEFIIQASHQDAESIFSSKVPLIKGVKFKNAKLNIDMHGIRIFSYYVQIREFILIIL